MAVEAKTLAQQRLVAGESGSIAPQKLVEAVNRTERAYEKAVTESLHRVKTGSGKVGLLLPKTYHPSSSM